MRTARTGLMVALGLLLCAFGVGAWFVSPIGRQYQLSRADLPTLGRETEQHPNDGQAWYYFGVRLREKGASMEAIGALRHALQRRPNDARVRVELGWALLEHHEIEEAFQLAKAASGTAPNESAPRELLARLYQRTGAYHKAEEQWQTVLSRYPKNHRAAYFVAFCYLQMQQVDRAVATADRALAGDPRSPDYLRLRASIAAAAGDLGGATTYYRRAIEADPIDPRSYHDLTNFLLTQNLSEKDIGAAAGSLAQLRKLEPAHPLIPWHEARLAVARQDWPAAVRLLEIVRRLTPGLTEADFQLANANYRVGKKTAGDAAMASYRKRSELTRRIDELRIRRELSTDAKLLFSLAKLEREAGMLDDAERTVRSGLRLNPGSPLGRGELNAIERLRRSPAH